MKNRFAILTRSQHAHHCHLVCSINGQEHGFRRHPVETYIISVLSKEALDELKEISGVSTFFAL